MKRIAVAFLCLGAGLALRAAEEEFSRALRGEDFSSAGLGKLTAAELARLDELVRDFKRGALEEARRQAAASAQAQAEAEAKAARAVEESRQAKTEAENKSEGGGLLAKAKVLLTPGTKVEYSTIDTRLVGDFRGWRRGTVFTLENGQRWKVTSGDSYVSSTILSPKVKIEPGALGSFWLRIEGVKVRAKIEPFGVD